MEHLLPSFDESLEAELSELAALHRLRSCPPLGGDSRIRPLFHDLPVLSFASNDYLGLASDSRVRQAAAAAALQEGAGSAASRLVSGDLPGHRSLESALARHLRVPAALLFPTGYQTNLAVIPTLCGPGDLIVSDALNHASLIDGCRLSRAAVRVYPHGDISAARTALSSGSFRRRLLVTESIFSMDGDLAPLPALADLVREHEAWLVVDEAHAYGLLGPQGRGCCAALGVTPHVLVATLGKALGSFGGFVAGSLALRSLLVNRARTFLFTTAAPPAVAAASETALGIVAGPEGDQLRAALQRNISALRDLLALSTPVPATGLQGAIVPLILGSDQRALAASQHLRDRGIFVPAIRPPTVPPGTARLRVTLSAAHQLEDIAALASALVELPA